GPVGIGWIVRAVRVVEVKPEKQRILADAADDLESVVDEWRAVENVWRLSPQRGREREIIESSSEPAGGGDQWVRRAADRAIAVRLQDLGERRGIVREAIAVRSDAM